jgi:hypothetical protein
LPSVRSDHDAQRFVLSLPVLRLNERLQLVTYSYFYLELLWTIPCRKICRTKTSS